MKEDKNNREQAHVEQMVLLNQSKEKMENMEEELQELKERNQAMQDKINKRNEQIARIGRGMLIYKIRIIMSINKIVT